jgi:hypothetical protein
MPETCRQETHLKPVFHYCYGCLRYYGERWPSSPGKGPFGTDLECQFGKGGYEVALGGWDCGCGQLTQIQQSMSQGRPPGVVSQGQATPMNDGAPDSAISDCELRRMWCEAEGAFDWPPWEDRDTQIGFMKVSNLLPFLRSFAARVRADKGERT